MEKGFRRIALNVLKQHRRGKHDKLTRKILDELATLPDGEAITIPLSEAKQLSVSKLRSAVARATSSRGLKIATYSDDTNFYVWNRTKKTARYERNVKRAYSVPPRTEVVDNKSESRARAGEGLHISIYEQKNIRDF